MGRSSRCDIASGIRRGQWTADEDQKLFTYIQQHGHGSWSLLPEKAGLQRCGKSCRFRWTNYLRPGIKRGDFSLHEEQTIIQLHALLGNRWSAIAMYLPKRTDNEIKNHWNTHLKKRLARSGIDPVTHKSRISTIASMSINGNADSKNASKLSHMAQWESVRLEAEGRSVRESKLRGSEPVNNMATRNINVPPRCLDVLTAWQNIVRNDDKTGQSINPLALRGEEQNIDQRDHMDVEEIYGTHVQQFWNDNEDNVDWEPSYIYMRPSIL